MSDFLIFIWANFLIGISSFGGGKAFIPIYQSIFVDTFHIVNTLYLTEIVAFASSLPGPIAPMITGPIGFNLFGNKGLIFGLLSLGLPTMLIYLVAMNKLNKIHNRNLDIVYKYLNPAIIGLLFFVSFTLLFNFNYGMHYFYYSLSVFLICFVFLHKTKIHPALIIFISGIIGIFLL